MLVTRKVPEVVRRQSLPLMVPKLTQLALTPA